MWKTRRAEVWSYGAMTLMTLMTLGKICGPAGLKKTLDKRLTRA